LEETQTTNTISNCQSSFRASSR